MRKIIAVVFGAALMLTAACAGTDYGRGEAIDDLVESGMTEKEAECVADEMEAQEIDFSDANESEKGDELFDKVVAIGVDCKTAK